MTKSSANPFSLITPEARYFLPGLIASICLAVATPLLPLTVVTPLYNEVLVLGRFEQVWPLAWRALALSTISALAMYAQDVLFGVGAAQFGTRMRAMVFERLLAANPLTTLPDERSGDEAPRSATGRVTRAALDVRELETFFSQDLAIIASQGLTILVAVLLMMLESARFTLGLVVLMLLLFAALGQIGRRVEHEFRRTQRAAEVATSRMGEGLGKLEVVKAFRLERVLIERFVAPNSEQAATLARRSQWLALQAPLSQLSAIVGLGALLAVALREVAAGRLNAGQLTAYLVLLGLLISPVQMIARSAGRLAMMREPTRSLHALIAEQAEADSGTLETPPLGWRGELRFENVTTHYPSAGQPVLSGLNLTLHPGEVVALVGPSGGGKTSVARLLLRFLQPDAGRVLLDGQDLGAYRLSSLRARVALVPQHPGLFAGSVRDNLLLARPDADDAVLWQALESAGLAEQLRSMPNGLGTALGDDGAGLSGGQAQRLAIARALLCDATVLILDEPTSALDATSEAAIERTIDALRGRTTVLLIAHQASTVACADRVVRLEDGKIVARTASAVPALVDRSRSQCD